MKKVGIFLSLVFVISILMSGAAQAQERKRWSPQAKGAVIGAGTGAAAGAIIHKRNRAVGGVVGGVVGGATGYAIGKHTDNKRKEAARVAAANRAAANRAAARRTASSRSVAAKKSNNQVVREVVVYQPMPAAYNGFTGAHPSMMYDANGNPLPYAMNAAYLPNPHYGDRAKPYSSYEYRRKSW